MKKIEMMRSLEELQRIGQRLAKEKMLTIRDKEYTRKDLEGKI